MRRFLRYFRDRMDSDWWVLPLCLIVLVGCAVAIGVIDWDEYSLWGEIAGKLVLASILTFYALALVMVSASVALESHGDGKDLKERSMRCQFDEYKKRLLRFSEAVGKWQKGEKSKPNSQFTNLARAYIVLLGLVDGHFGPFARDRAVYHREVEEKTGVGAWTYMEDYRPGVVQVDVERWNEDASCWEEISDGHFEFKITL